MLLIDDKVGQVGVEPTVFLRHGFTVRCNRQLCLLPDNTCKPTRTTISYYDVCSPFTPYMYAIVYYQFQLLGRLLNDLNILSLARLISR